jgi:hypothetical protein
LQSSSIEADDDLVVYRDDRHGHSPRSRYQFFPRRCVVCDVLRRELDAMGRKELFRRVTGLSG